jgi:phosphoglycerol transferase
MSETRNSASKIKHPWILKLLKVILSVFVVLGSILLGFSYWISQHFGVITIDQALINLQGAGGEGSGGSIVMSAVMFGLVVPLLVSSAILFGVSRLSASKWRQRLSRIGQTALVVLITAILVAVPVAGASSFSHQVSLNEYLRAMRSGLDLNDFYAVPEIVGNPDEKPKNLVVVYMESVEQKLTDDSLFGKDMLAPLEQATTGWDSVDLHQPANGGWTLGGVVDTQCGLPLRMANAEIHGNALNTTGESLSSYLPGATCLGDVLQKQGYTSVFLGGASTKFAGKGTFLRDHGYSQVVGFDEWKKTGETEAWAWGLSDRRLFVNAKTTIDRLESSSQPFMLTLLTLDTHPNDHVQPYCSVDTEKALSSIYRCSMDEVAGFVSYMHEQGYLDDTVVVLMGDHLRMVGEGDSFRNELASRTDRTIFNRIWSPNGIDIRTRSINQFDMYPTILETLGYQLKNHRAGIGVSALTDDAGTFTIKSLAQEAADSLVQSRSQDFYNRMWGVRSDSSTQDTTTQEGSSKRSVQATP